MPQQRAPSGKQYNFAGARIIDEKKFAALADGDFLEWRKRGWLALIYAHLISLGQITHLTDLYEKGGGAPEGGE